MAETVGIGVYLAIIVFGIVLTIAWIIVPFADRTPLTCCA
jgi:hypothetical protein